MEINKETLTYYMTNRIDYLAKYKNLTNMDIAKATGINHDSISMWRLGKRTPTIFALRKLCEFFEVSSDFLLCLNNNIPLKYQQNIDEK